jgi:hypothetical protein
MACVLGNRPPVLAITPVMAFRGIIIPPSIIDGRKMACDQSIVILVLADITPITLLVVTKKLIQKDDTKNVSIEHGERPPGRGRFPGSGIACSPVA